MALYFISGVWKNSNGVITHLNLHKTINNGQSFDAGVKTAENKVIALIALGNIIRTLRWSYPAWSPEQDVRIINVGTSKYLRSVKDGVPTNNLDNLIIMDQLTEFS